VTAEQDKLIIAAHSLIKKAFPTENLQFCFNLSREHDNVNYNIKQSGILKTFKKG